MLMGALGQWVEQYSKRFSTLEFFVIGGGLVLADIDDSAELNRIVAENPFTPFMDVEIMPVVEPGTAMAATVRSWPPSPLQRSLQAEGLRG